MATRLQRHLPDLVANNQTAFVKSRSMMESFLVTRELLTFCTKKKLPSVLYMVDFEKAFDTVNWCYLINILVERGFPPRWVAVVLNILSLFSSMVKVNGSQTHFF